MAKGSVHPRVLGYLGRALSLEFSAVQQYMTQASLVESWGDTAAADQFRRDTVEEMQHAERIVQHMLGLGVVPAASQLRPVTHAPDLVALLRRNAVLEHELIAHYAEAMQFCQLVGDNHNHALFEGLWQDERHHGDDLAQWLASLGASERNLPARASF
jgi:bacterioferritin